MNKMFVGIILIGCLYGLEAGEIKTRQSNDMTIDDAKTILHCLEQDFTLSTGEIGTKYCKEHANPTACAIAAFIHGFLKGLEDKGLKKTDSDLIDEFSDFALDHANTASVKTLLDHVLDTLVTDFGAEHIGTLSTLGKAAVKQITSGDTQRQDKALACFTVNSTEPGRSYQSRVLDALRQLLKITE